MWEEIAVVVGISLLSAPLVPLAMFLLSKAGLFPPLKYKETPGYEQLL
jgi:hypothetical protein